MVTLLVHILKKHYMWTWIREFAVGLATLNKHVYGVLRDNILAEVHVVGESRDIQYLVELWCEYKISTCEGCDDSYCFGCTAWSKHESPEEPTPESSHASDDS